MYYKLLIRFYEKKKLLILVDIELIIVLFNIFRHMRVCIFHAEEIHFFFIGKHLGSNY